MDMLCTDNQFRFVEYTHIRISICTDIGYLMANYYYVCKNSKIFILQSLFYLISIKLHRIYHCTIWLQKCFQCYETFGKIYSL